MALTIIAGLHVLAALLAAGMAIPGLAQEAIAAGAPPASRAGIARATTPRRVLPLFALLATCGALAVLPNGPDCTTLPPIPFLSDLEVGLTVYIVATLVIVLALALVPPLERLRRGRAPSPARARHGSATARAIDRAVRIVAWATVPFLAADSLGHAPAPMALAIGFIAGCCALSLILVPLRWRALRRAANALEGNAAHDTTVVPLRSRPVHGRTATTGTALQRLVEAPRLSDTSAGTSTEPADEPIDPGQVANAAIAAARPILAGAGAISIVMNLLMLTGPLFMLQVYDRVLTSRSAETLAVLTLLLVGLYVALGVLDLIRSRIFARLALKLDRHLGPALHRAATTDSRDAGQPLRDLEQVRQVVAGPVPGALLDLPFAPFYFVLIYLLHPWLGLLATAGVALLAALSVANQRLARKPSLEAADALARCHAFVEAGRRNAETLKAMGIGVHHARRWGERHRAALSRQLVGSDRAATFTVAIRIGRLLLQSLMLALGAWLALNDHVSAGAMIAASIIATRALAPVEQLIGQWQSLSAARAAWHRCKTALERLDPDIARIQLPRPAGALDVSKLFVVAPGGTEPLIKGVTFSLSPGDCLAVLGHSAAGKSTLARALVGAWPVRHGTVRLDGAALTQWPAAELGRHIGYLPQDVGLFEGTIAENIARLETTPDETAVLEAAQLAGVHDMIVRLPAGYQSPVGEAGSVLSGGQRQRIGLARAIYKCPALVVLDEPNANLDAEGEAALIRAISTLRRYGTTVVVMAHRQSVLATASHVLVLDGGRQTKFGPADAVLARLKPARPHPVRSQSAQPLTATASVSPLAHVAAGTTTRTSPTTATIPEPGAPHAIAPARQAS